MEILKIRSNNTSRYGFTVTRRANQLFLDLNIGKTTYMIAFGQRIK